MNLTNEILLTILGAAILFLVFHDVHATVLRATKRKGVFSASLNQGSWWIATRLTRSFNLRLRHRILSKVGPLLMPSIISLFILIMMTGFALIYLPRLETGFKIEDATGTSRLFQAFYISGVTLLTVGYGDIVPISQTTRALCLRRQPDLLLFRFR